jgi:hypothetical protein
MNHENPLLKNVTKKPKENQKDPVKKALFKTDPKPVAKTNPPPKADKS